MNNKFRDSLAIIIGCFVFAFGVNYFILANGLAEGGFTGIGLILHYTFGFPISLFTLISNIPLVIIGWKLWGKEFLGKTLLGVVCLSIALEVTTPFQLKVDDLLLAALYGGILSGTGLGIIIRFGGTTGGTDIIGRIANQYFGISMGKFYLIFDFLVLCTVAIIYGLTVALYSMVIIFVYSKVVDLIVEGLDSAKQALIISNNPEVVGKIISNELNRGFTVLNGRGGYGGGSKDVVLCVVNRFQIFKLKTKIHEVDPNAFIIVSEVYEALGQGFKTK